MRNPQHYSAYNSYGSRKHYTVLQRKALETQLTLLVFEQKFHVKAENVLHCQISLKIYIYKKNIATQELEKEVPLALSEEKLNQNHSISTQLQVTCISTSSPTSPSIPSCW